MLKIEWEVVFYCEVCCVSKLVHSIHQSLKIIWTTGNHYAFSVLICSLLCHCILSMSP